MSSRTWSSSFFGGSSTYQLDPVIDSGYNIARMRYEIILSPEAIEDLRSLKAHWRATVRDAIERHLRHDPTKESKSRIKRLRGMSRPQFRLRVDEIRVFYDVSEGMVEILAIIPKSEAESWLEKAGERE
jgi:mRNA interferase RelE/StbE